MQRFIVKKIDPFEHKEQIVQLWQECLACTPRERFEWMRKGNPAGSATWFLAFEGGHELAGVISIMPRELSFNGKTIRVGVLGDFMIRKKNRVFGPALQLLRAASNSISELGLQFIYTIPNTYSERLVQRAGFKEIGRVFYFAKPIRLHHYLRKYLNPVIAKTIGSFVDLGLRLFSRETYTISRGYFDEVDAVDELFHVYWDKVVLRENGLVGNRAGKYLAWRYFSSPHEKFHLVTLRDKPQGELQGHIVYVIKENRLEIYDIIAENMASANQLIRHVILVGRHADCKCIYIAVGPRSPWVRRMKWYLFFDSGFDMRLYAFGNEDLAMTEWSFFAGDRNI